MSYYETESGRLLWQLDKLPSVYGKSQSDRDPHPGGAWTGERKDRWSMDR